LSSQPYSSKIDVFSVSLIAEVFANVVVFVITADAVICDVVNVDGDALSSTASMKFISVNENGKKDSTMLSTTIQINS